MEVPLWGATYDFEAIARKLGYDELFVRYLGEGVVSAGV